MSCQETSGMISFSCRNESKFKDGERGWTCEEPIRSGDAAAGGGIAGDLDAAVVDFDFGAITEVDDAWWLGGGEGRACEEGEDEGFHVRMGGLVWRGVGVVIRR